MNKVMSRPAIPGRGIYFIEHVSNRKRVIFTLMKRCFVLLSFFFVFLSLASNIVAGIFVCSIEMEMVEKGKEVKDEPDFEKDKIFHSNNTSLSFLGPLETQNLHPVIKISSLVLDAEINPPDSKVA
jgi:hypothetical protein